MDKRTYARYENSKATSLVFLLYTDESNLDPAAGEFFVYGGIAIPGASAASLTDNIEAIRNSAKLPPDFPLKFNPGPTHLSHPEFIELKKAVIQAACVAGCVFVTSLILHAIATSAEDARRNQIGRIGYHFDCLLGRFSDSGLVLVDRFTDKQIDGHLREKFSIGLVGMPYSKTLRLKRILGFHYSAIGQSHFSSLIDILIGCLRFAVNAYDSENEAKKKTAFTLLSQMSPLFFREPGPAVSDLSIHFSPQVIKAAKYRAKYERLKTFFESAGIPTRQPITDQRRY